MFEPLGCPSFPARWPSQGASRDVVRTTLPRGGRPSCAHPPRGLGARPGHACSALGDASRSRPALTERLLQDSSKTAPPSTSRFASSPTRAHEALGLRGVAAKPHPRSAFAVSHRPDGLLREELAGLLHPAADPGVHHVSALAEPPPGEVGAVGGVLVDALPFRAFPARTADATSPRVVPPRRSPTASSARPRGLAPFEKSGAPSARCRDGGARGSPGLPLLEPRAASPPCPAVPPKQRVRGGPKTAVRGPPAPSTKPRRTPSASQAPHAPAVVSPSGPRSLASRSRRQRLRLRVRSSHASAWGCRPPGRGRRVLAGPPNTRPKPRAKPSHTPRRRSASVVPSTHPPVGSWPPPALRAVVGTSHA
jgi:hypothetical protein